MDQYKMMFMQVEIDIWMEQRIIRGGLQRSGH